MDASSDPLLGKISEVIGVWNNALHTIAPDSLWNHEYDILLKEVMDTAAAEYLESNSVTPGEPAINFKIIYTFLGALFKNDIEVVKESSATLTEQDLDVLQYLIKDLYLLIKTMPPAKIKEYTLFLKQQYSQIRSMQPPANPGNETTVTPSVEPANPMQIPKDTLVHLLPDVFRAAHS